MTYGIKIARPDYSVITAEDDDLVYSSKFSTLSPFACVKFTAVGNSTHGMSYPPAYFYVVDYGTEPNNKWSVNNPPTEMADGMFFSSLGQPAHGPFFGTDTTITVDSTKVYCDDIAADVDAIYVFLLHEPLNST